MIVGIFQAGFVSFAGEDISFGCLGFHQVISAQGQHLGGVFSCGGGGDGVHQFISMIPEGAILADHVLASVNLEHSTRQVSFSKDGLVDGIAVTVLLFLKTGQL